MIVLRRDQRSTLTVLLMKITNRIDLNSAESKFLELLLKYCIKVEPDIQIRIRLFLIYIHGITNEVDRQFLLGYLTGLEIASMR